MRPPIEIYIIQVLLNIWAIVLSKPDTDIFLYYIIVYLGSKKTKALGVFDMSIFCLWIVTLAGFDNILDHLLCRAYMFMEVFILPVSPSIRNNYRISLIMGQGTR